MSNDAQAAETYLNRAVETHGTQGDRFLALATAHALIAIAKELEATRLVAERSAAMSERSVKFIEAQASAMAETLRKTSAVADEMMAQAVKARD